MELIGMILSKKKVMLILGIIIFMIIIIVMLIFTTFNDGHIIYQNSNSNYIIKNNSLTMMYETGYETGEYQVSSDTSWPQEEYVFNEKLSKCENGSKITWDDENKRVVMQANTSDKCYVYFDKNELIIESYRISLGAFDNYLLDVVMNQNVEINKYYLELSNGITLSTDHLGYSVWAFCNPLGGYNYDPNSPYTYSFYVETVDGRKSKSVYGKHLGYTGEGTPEKVSC